MAEAKRDWLHVGCEGGHDWRTLGGCNAGCHADCSCSVPVNFCRRCGDCDYGDNADAEQVRVDCAALWGDPVSRWASTALPPNPATAE
jgi:hypothetical protein